MGMFSFDPIEFERRVGNKSIDLAEEMKEINFNLLKEIYPIFGYLNLEYKKRYKSRLKK